MKIVFDMDGTICEGLYIEQPTAFARYMGLAPYDRDTMWVLHQLCRNHDVYVMTARRFAGAAKFTKLWFERNCELPLDFAGFITGIDAPNKVRLTHAIGAEVIFDDHPDVYYNAFPDGPQVYLVDNPGWEYNQSVDTQFRVKSWKQIHKIINELKDTQCASQQLTPTPTKITG